MSNDYLEGLISELTYRIEQLETKVEKLDNQLNTRQNFKDGIAETVEKLSKDVKELKVLESRVDDLENP